MQWSRQCVKNIVCCAEMIWGRALRAMEKGVQVCGVYHRAGKVGAYLPVKMKVAEALIAKAIRVLF
ncbi:hypothetical protein GA0116948_10837 [Chitinophaga costaii]|uniref:Uncharacterized protein n=1 Tax=Chitinophaga costaii TaxID=1335309 RepID=A0A1C4EDX6_9BACT|nr:hypothetical protein GA0116948_10837 [Chitinophaga costaii]